VRIYIYTCVELGCGSEALAWPKASKIFPKHDELRAGEFGNAIRGPLEFIERKPGGMVHGADYALEKQVAYLTDFEN